MAKKKRTNDFQGLPTVPKSDDIIERCFKDMRKSRLPMKSRKFQSTHAKKRAYAKTSITSFAKSAYTSLHDIVTSFPNISSMTETQKQLISLEYTIDSLKISLARIKGTLPQVRRFERQYMGKTRMHLDELEYDKHINSAIARITSLIKRLDSTFVMLESFRKTLRELPVIRDDMPVCAISGFPNVGKSTLLAKLTSAKPEISSYPFTTKGLNLGILSKSSLRIQLIDTPGALNRSKANIIEQRAYVILENAADIAVFVYDPTNHYSLQDQLLLFERVKKIIGDNKVLFYVSKGDIVNNPLESLPDKISKNAILDHDKIASLIFERIAS
jgi:nucleolar GTP-binding protein